MFGKRRDFGRLSLLIWAALFWAFSLGQGVDAATPLKEKIPKSKAHRGPDDRGCYEQQSGTKNGEAARNEPNPGQATVDGDSLASMPENLESHDSIGGAEITDFHEKKDE